jgi:hypothetical protein
VSETPGEELYRKLVAEAAFGYDRPQLAQALRVALERVAVEREGLARDADGERGEGTSS